MFYALWNSQRIKVSFSKELTQREAIESSPESTNVKLNTTFVLLNHFTWNHPLRSLLLVSSFLNSPSSLFLSSETGPHIAKAGLELVMEPRKTQNFWFPLSLHRLVPLHPVYTAMRGQNQHQVHARNALCWARYNSSELISELTEASKLTFLSYCQTGEIFLKAIKNGGK